MRSALHLLEKQEASDELVRQAVVAGLESGESQLTLKEIAEKMNHANHL